MADVTTTITYTYQERFFNDVYIRNNVKNSQPDEGFGSYSEAVEDAAQHGIPSFEIKKVFIKVTA